MKEPPWLEAATKAVGDCLYGYCDPYDTPNTWDTAKAVANAAVSAYLAAPQAPESRSRDGTRGIPMGLRKGGINLSSQIIERPDDPSPLRPQRSRTGTEGGTAK